LNTFAVTRADNGERLSEFWGDYRKPLTSFNVP
jgi:hypothetical protein